ncbi:MAG TPA: OB-fold domain-containing protein [Rhodocyclaceae bacterium]|nr:OB-fold domain-containing protein [Rhodocyclaceae bacterium]
MSTESAFSGPGPDHVFQQYLSKGEFRIQRCRDCGKHVFYPRLTCTGCGSIALEWVQPSGSGTVHAVSIVNRQADKGGPYNVVLVDLKEGPRMMGRVDGIPHEAVKIGMAVKAKIDTSGEAPFVAFDAA